MTTQLAPTGTRIYGIDPTHSAVTFAVRHLMISKIRGVFSKVAGEIELSATGNVPTRIEATIEAASLDTGEPQRDGHLGSPEFFDAATYPELTFRSTRIVGTDTDFTVTGNLTIHGTTAPVILEAAYGGAGRDHYGNDRVGFEAHTTISRATFGLTWNQPIDGGGVVIGDEVEITLSLEAIAIHA